MKKPKLEFKMVIDFEFYREVETAVLCGTKMSEDKWLRDTADVRRMFNTDDEEYFRSTGKRLLSQYGLTYAQKSRKAKK